MKSNLYTKKGDAGETSLVDGLRVLKSHAKIKSYGEVDELNSSIGLSRSLISGGLIDDQTREELDSIQARLFDLGSLLACPVQKRDEFKLPQLNERHIAAIEDGIDRYDAELPKLKNFILPGGHASAASFHVSRTICRRLERTLVELRGEDEKEVPETILRFINRLSDYLFVVARLLNFRSGHSEKIWKN